MQESIGQHSRRRISIPDSVQLDIISHSSSSVTFPVGGRWSLLSACSLKFTIWTFIVCLWPIQHATGLNCTHIYHPRSSSPSTLLYYYFLVQLRVGYCLFKFRCGRKFIKFQAGNSLQEYIRGIGWAVIRHPRIYLFIVH